MKYLRLGVKLNYKCLPSMHTALVSVTREKRGERMRISRIDNSTDRLYIGALVAEERKRTK